MKRNSALMRVFCLALALTAAASSTTLAAGRPELPGIAAAFVAEEVEGASPERQRVIAECLISAFDGIGDQELEVMLGEEDFEESLDVLIETYPDREAIVERCEDL
jgi:hypothetical protein